MAARDASAAAGWHREAEDLRVRMDREWNPLERSRTRVRLREVQEQGGPRRLPPLGAGPYWRRLAALPGRRAVALVDSASV